MILLTFNKRQCMFVAYRLITFAARLWCFSSFLDDLLITNVTGPGNLLNSNGAIYRIY